MATTTPNRGYQLPAAGNKLKDDVLRLIAALGSIDADVAALLLALADKSNVGHGHGMDAITGLVAALGNKLDVGYHDALANLTDVDVAGVANGMALLRQASKWIPVALQINNIAGLEAALNGKATPADITAAINALVAAAPGALDTLNELAAALGNDPNFAATVTAALGGKLAKAQNFADVADKAAARNNLEVPSSAAFQTLLDGVLRKDQDQNSQALSAGLKVNLLKNTLQAWEKVRYIPPGSAVAQIDELNLGAFDGIRARGYLGVSAVADVGLRVSSDNGATFIAANYQQDTLRWGGGSVIATTNNTNAAYLNAGANVGPASDTLVFDLEIMKFNKAQVSLFRCATRFTTGSQTVSVRNDAAMAGALAWNAIRFIGVGGLLISGGIMIEGYRE